jgi:hypothetical protein
VQALRPPALSQDFEVRLTTALAMEPPVDRSCATPELAASDAESETTAAHHRFPALTALFEHPLRLSIAAAAVVAELGSVVDLTAALEG